MSGRSNTIYQRPLEILRNLVRYDTTNPPGNERACIQYLDGLLRDAGIETTICAKVPERPSLVARLPGRGEAPPLMLYGHVDVVTTVGQVWQHPPFAGEIADGCLWGRGTLDMKGAMAMMLAAMLRAKAEGFAPAGDLLYVALADEENAGIYGARYMVDEHPELFQGVRYALGELGGFPLYIGGKRFYGIQVAEKQVCRMEAKVRGPAGHASMPIRGGTMAKLAKMLATLDQRRLPVHITPVVRMLLEGVAEGLGEEGRFARQLLDPAQTDGVLDALGAEGLLFNAMLHNTVSPTIVQGGHQANVIPSEATVLLDGRALPGFRSDDVLAEVQALLGPEVELSLVRYDPGPQENPDMGLFGLLGDALREADLAAIPIPYMLAATTDARFFAKLGIQTYGYTPMNLPPDINVLRSAHNADERAPVECIDFGAEVLYRVVQRYRGKHAA